MFFFQLEIEVALPCLLIHQCWIIESLDNKVVIVFILSNDVARGQAIFMVNDYPGWHHPCC
jgi:hypothetical protein